MITQEDALVWIAGLFEEPVQNVTPDRARDEIYGWDSLGVLSLMAELDEKFNIRLDEKQASGMTSVRDLLALLKQHGALAP